LADRLAAAGGELLPFPAASKNPVRILANARAIGTLITRLGVDLIHARSRAPAWSGLIAARARRVPLVTTYHGAYGETNAIKRAYNSVMARGDVVIANSRFTAALIAQRYGTPTERIASIHRGVDTTFFDPDAIASERVAELYARCAAAETTRLILHPARLTGWKGQSVVIEAARRLRARDERADWTVILAGDAQGRPDYVHRLQSQIDAAGLSSAVRLVGHVEDIPAAYRAAHVAVIASTEPEAFGRTAVEAQAMQCPIIAT